MLSYHSQPGLETQYDLDPFTPRSTPRCRSISELSCPLDDSNDSCAELRKPLDCDLDPTPSKVKILLKMKWFAYSGPISASSRCINQYNFYSVSMAWPARLSGMTVESVFNSKIDEAVP